MQIYNRESQKQPRRNNQSLLGKLATELCIWFQLALQKCGKTYLKFEYFSQFMKKLFLPTLSLWHVNYIIPSKRIMSKKDTF